MCFFHLDNVTKKRFHGIGGTVSKKKFFYGMAFPKINPHEY